MPAVSSRSGRRRRLVNEINVVPYIDVMLVLLVIFMVTAPMQPPGTIDLPKVGKSDTRRDAYVEVQVRPNGELRIRGVNSGDPTERRVTRAELASALRQVRTDPKLPVVISGDKSVRYEDVTSVMDELQRQGVERIGLMVKQN